MVVAYEDYLDADRSLGLKDASRHFEDRSRVHLALNAAAVALDELGVPYAVIGAMALFFHGYRRFSTDIDLLVCDSDWSRLESGLLIRGYTRVPERKRSFRDRTHGVRIDFFFGGSLKLKSGGEYKLPTIDPAERRSIKSKMVLSLPKVLEAKLAIGASHPLSLKHVADVQEAICKIGLPRSLARRIHPAVAGDYIRLWEIAKYSPQPDWCEDDYSGLPEEAPEGMY